MKRREFLKKAGIGSAALASLPALANTLSIPAWADDEGIKVFIAVASRAPEVDGVMPVVGMPGFVQVNRSRVRGGGNYNIIDRATPIPRAILSAGTWEARRLVSADRIGTFGAFAAGIIEMEVNLVQRIPSRDVIPATLQVVCSLGDGGLLIGKEEGITLTIPDGEFGPFEPFVPPAGITLFGVRIEEKD